MKQLLGDVLPQLAGINPPLQQLKMRGQFLWTCNFGIPEWFGDVGVDQIFSFPAIAILVIVEELLEFLPVAGIGRNAGRIDKIEQLCRAARIAHDRIWMNLGRGITVDNRECFGFRQKQATKRMAACRWKARRPLKWHRRP